MFRHSLIDRLRLSGLIFLFLFSTAAGAAVLSVPYHFQENNQWCWAGVSQMSLEYFGKTNTQTELANYGTGGVNTWNYLTGSYAASGGEPAKKGIDLILKNFGDIGSTLFSRALTGAELKTEIEGSRPAIARLGWYSGTTPLGGHFIVLKGYDEATGGVSINDPWKDTGPILVDYTALTGGPAGTYDKSTVAHKWTHTLTLSASLDVIFLIDSTGSMYDDIANVKTNANTLLDDLTKKFKDYRIGVADYQDNPDGDHGASYDHILQVDTVFTTNLAAAKAAINSISLGNGMDLPEAVYSAAYRAIAGTEFGSWRDAPTKRLIILMGDAPGHFPAEPWAGGHSQAEVISQAVASKVSIQALLTGSSGGSTYSEAETDFTSMAAGSGGALWKVEDPSKTATVMEEVIDAVAADPRFPRGTVADFKPTFVFNSVGDGMANSPKKLYLELSIQKKGAYKKLKRVTLAATAQQWTPPAELAKGVYKWRLGFQTNASKILAPDGSLLKKAPGGVRFEDSYQQFERVDVTPGTAEQLEPSSFFTPTAGTVTYKWTKASNASKYALLIRKDGKLWRKKIVKPSKKDPNASILQATISGHKATSSYSWEVQGLNYDHPKPTLTP